MRSFTDGNGNDSTAAVKAYLAGAQQIRFADLYLIGEQEDPLATWLTNWETDLTWSAYVNSSLPQMGVFLHSAISRDRITSKIGLDSPSMSVEWSPQLTAFGTTVSTQNPYQRAQAGFHDNMTFRLWRCVMGANAGDCNTYGATPWFGGRIGKTEIARGKIKFTVDSFLSALSQKVPPNVIEASNALAGFSGAVPVLADSESSLPTFKVVVPSSSNPPLSPTTFLGQCLSPTPGKIYEDASHTNKFALGYLQFLPGSTLAGYWSPIASDWRYDAGGGNYYNAFEVFGAFPFAPSPGDEFYASTELPPDYATALAVGAGFKGFPFVPQPQTAI